MVMLISFTYIFQFNVFNINKTGSVKIMNLTFVMFLKYFYIARTVKIVLPYVKLEINFVDKIIQMHNEGVRLQDKKQHVNSLGIQLLKQS